MSDRLHFTRESLRRTSDDKLLEGLRFIADRAIAGPRGRKWSYEIGPIEAQKVFESWIFTTWVRFYPRVPFPPHDQEREELQRAEIIQWAAATGHNARFGNSPWQTKGHKQEHKRADDSTTIDPLDDTSEVVSLSSVSKIQKGSTYEHLYGLDPQINMLLSAIQAAADSNMANRFHTLLWGDPGCGKTDILLSTSSLLSQMGIAHIAIDATSATEAGVRKSLLDEDALLPEIILIEEVEKTPENSLRWLLGLMDDRATISQTNYRKTASRKVPALILATANDYKLLSKMMYGALLSRFSNEVYCPRPNREILAKILKREVEKVKGGNLAWIEPTLTFCYDKKGITDPRTLKRICLCGKDRLISGEYQKDLEMTMKDNGPVTTSKVNVSLYDE